MQNPTFSSNLLCSTQNSWFKHPNFPSSEGLEIDSNWPTFPRKEAATSFDQKPELKGNQIGGLIPRPLCVMSTSLESGPKKSLGPRACTLTFKGYTSKRKNKNLNQIKNARFFGFGSKTLQKLNKEKSGPLGLAPVASGLKFKEKCGNGTIFESGEKPAQFPAKNINGAPKKQTFSKDFKEGWVGASRLVLGQRKAKDVNSSFSQNKELNLCSNLDNLFEKTRRSNFMESRKSKTSFSDLFATNLFSLDTVTRRTNANSFDSPDIQLKKVIFLFFKKICIKI